MTTGRENGGLQIDGDEDTEPQEIDLEIGAEW
jgi:hypothetical protein